MPIILTFFIHLFKKYLSSASCKPNKTPQHWRFMVNKTDEAGPGGQERAVMGNKLSSQVLYRFLGREADPKSHI